MPGRRRPAGRAELVEMELQSRGQRAGPVPFGRVNDHARRLVDHRQMSVFVQDIERDVFRRRALARQVGQRDRDVFAAVQPIGRFDAQPIDFDARGIDDLVQQHAAVAGKLPG